MGANPSLVPFFQALRVAQGRDYVTSRPNAAWLTLRWIMELIPDRNGRPYYPCRKPSSYGTEDFLGGNGGMSHGGWFSQGFGAIPDPSKPALLWVYRNFCAKADPQGFDTVNYPHRAILALVNWPVGVEPKNPAEVMPRTSVDRIHGYYVFRNRWQDADDIVVTAWLGSGPKGHMSPGGGTTYVWGLGQRLHFGEFGRGVTTYYEAKPDGSGVLCGSDGNCLAVDFSRASGADGLLVMVGPGASNVKPPEKPLPGVNVSTVTAGKTKYAVLILSKDAAPEAKADGEKLVVGGQTVSFDGQKIMLAK
jgi:hypothetical protein